MIELKVPGMQSFCLEHLVLDVNGTLACDGSLIEGVAERLEVQVSYAIGVAHPTSIAVETFGTGKIPDEQIVKLVEDNFDLRPGAIICDLGLQRPIFKATAAYGHFGRDDIEAPWEKLDKVEAIKQQAGLA